MPELPEVEVVRAGLARHVVGRTVTGVEVLDPRWSALAGLLETETGQEGEQDAPTSGEEQA